MANNAYVSNLNFTYGLWQPRGPQEIAMSLENHLNQATWECRVELTTRNSQQKTLFVGTRTYGGLLQSQSLRSGINYPLLFA
jgi:hypothetical protein